MSNSAPTFLPTPTGAPSASACPFKGIDSSLKALEPQDRLYLPLHKRMVTQPVAGAGGTQAINLYYGDKDISFDEPSTFAFALGLGQQASFRADQACLWSGLEWPHVRLLLQELLIEGVLSLSHDAATADENTRHLEQASPLPPAPDAGPHARTWQDHPGLMAELTGLALDNGHLEMVVPVFRVVHMAQDADGRQIGEANVFPKALRIDVPTRWRTCIYSGTRHRVDRPMNVAALKAMRAHWDTAMGLLRLLRHAYLEKFPLARSGWTVGHVERLATCVLALPAVLLLRAQQPVANGSLHPALSSLFRVTDGLRMVMHQMLFVPLGEAARQPNDPVSAQDILDYAERNHSFHSEHGVCAGPTAMVDTFLRTVLDGANDDREAVRAIEVDSQIADAVSAIPQAVNYGLLGLRVYACMFGVWPAMARAYEETAMAAQLAAQRGHAWAGAMVHSLQAPVQRIRTATYLAHEEWRTHREQVFDDMDAQCHLGLYGTQPTARLAQRLVIEPSAIASLAAQLAAAAWQKNGDIDNAIDVAVDTADRAVLAQVLTPAAHFFLRLQAAIQFALEPQQHINQLLGRSPPLQRFTQQHADLHNRLQGDVPQRLPYLPDWLAHALQVQIDIDSGSLRVQPLPTPIRPAWCQVDTAPIGVN